MFSRILLRASSSLCLSMLAFSTFAQPLPIHPGIRQGSLKNGVRYLLQQNQEPETKLELRLLIKAGSLQEEDDQTGVAHFVEHMAFNGTRNFKENELIHYIESTGARFGADLNAYTAFEETVYQLQARTDETHFVDTAMQILLDWATQIAFDPDEIDKERGVVISEWRSRQSPQQRIRDQTFPFWYAGSPFPKRLPIGNPALLDTVRTERIRDYYDRWYKPENIGIVLVGDLPLDSMEHLVNRYFSGIPSTNIPEIFPEVSIPLPKDTQALIVTDPEAFTCTLEIQYRTDKYPLTTIKDYRNSLMVSLYNRMLNERLYEYTQRNKVPFTFAYSGYGNDLANLARHQISVTTDAAKLKDALTLVMQFTRDAREFGFLDSELDRHKRDLIKSAEVMVKEQDNIPSSRLATQLNSHLLKNTPVLSPEQIFDLYQTLLPTITTNDILDLAETWISDSNIRVLLTAPEKEKENLPSEPELLTWLQIYDNLEARPYQDDASDKILFEQSLPDGKIISKRYFPETGHSFWELENGVKVILKPTNFKNDEILVTAFSPGGHSIYPDDQYQNASNAANVIQMSGLEELDAVQLNKLLSGKKVQVAPYISELFEGFNGYCSPEELETLLQLTYLYVTRPGADQKALESMKTRQKNILKDIFNNPYYYYADILRKLKYQNHPRRQAILSTADIDQWNADESARIYKERFADTGDFTFIFVGNIDTTLAQTLLPKYLGNLPTTGRQESWKDPQAALTTGRIDSTIIKGSDPKARVDLTWHGEFDYSDATQRYEFYTMGAYLNTRLRENLREDLAAVYGVNLNTLLLPLPQQIYRINLSFECDPTRVDELIAAVTQEIALLQRGEIDLTALKNIFEIQRQERKEGLQQNNFWMQQLSVRAQYNLPLQSISGDSLEESIQSLRPEKLADMAKRSFGTENFFRIILLPEN